MPIFARENLRKFVGIVSEKVDILSDVWKKEGGGNSVEIVNLVLVQTPIFSIHF